MYLRRYAGRCEDVLFGRGGDVTDEGGQCDGQADEFHDGQSQRDDIGV